MWAPLCDPGREQRAETRRDVHAGGAGGIGAVLAREARLCGGAEYAIAPDEAPHPRALHGCQERGRLGERRRYPHEDCAAVLIVRLDHRGAPLPLRRTTTLPRFELPPVRAKICCAYRSTLTRPMATTSSCELTPWRLYASWRGCWRHAGAGAGRRARHCASRWRRRPPCAPARIPRGHPRPATRAAERAAAPW